MFLPMGAIYQLSLHFEFWHDLKVDNTMFSKDLLKD
jgi:hypothetical protein